MTIPPAAGRRPDSLSTALPDFGRTPAPSRRELLAWTVFALLPLSVLVALLVLHLMSASAAAATGGCGGG
jgi:hypothetical protein